MSQRGPTKLLRASVATSAVVFSLMTVGMIAVIVGGIKQSEVLVVSLYFGFCAGAAVASITSLLVSMRWAPLICLFAALASGACYLLEADLRGDKNAGPAFVLITVPLLVAAFVGAGLTRRKRPAAVPEARVHDGGDD